MKKESSRVIHINHTMDSLYGLLAEVYEELIDDEKEAAKRAIRQLIKELKQLSNSLEDEV